LKRFDAVSKSVCLKQNVFNTHDFEKKKQMKNYMVTFQRLVHLFYEIAFDIVRIGSCIDIYPSYYTEAYGR
jgi:hypothetical protein